MVNFTKHLQQTATYWKPNSENEFGKKVYDEPEFLKCRWEDRNELLRDKRGQEITSKSRVYFCTALDLDGFVFLGESWDTDPHEVNGAFEIRQIAKVPDLRNLTTLHVVYL